MSCLTKHKNCSLVIAVAWIVCVIFFYFFKRKPIQFNPKRTCFLVCVWQSTNADNSISEIVIQFYFSSRCFVVVHSKWRWSHKSHVRDREILLHFDTVHSIWLDDDLFQRKTEAHNRRSSCDFCQLQLLCTISSSHSKTSSRSLSLFPFTVCCWPNN